MSGAILGDVLSLNTRLVRQYAAKGIIKAADGKGYFLFDSVTSYAEHMQKRAAGHSTETGSSLADERARTERVDREMKELKLAAAKNQLVPAPEVEAAWADIALAIRRAVLQIPDKARSTIPHLTAHDGQTLRLICRESLEAAADSVDAEVSGLVAVEKLNGA